MQTAAILKSEEQHSMHHEEPLILCYYFVSNSEVSSLFLCPVQKCLKFIYQLDSNVQSKGNYPHQDPIWLENINKC